MQEWLDLFRRNRQSKILHIQHLRVLTGMKPHTLRVALGRLARKGVVQRICRGYYANPFNLPSLEEISACIYQPSYVSLESALSRHGILSQIPYALTCVTTRLPWRLSTSFGRIEYHQLKKSFFFGFSRQEGYWLAEPEKALVDLIYLDKRTRTQGGLSELHLESLRIKKLKAYTRRMHVELRTLEA